MHRLPHARSLPSRRQKQPQLPSAPGLHRLHPQDEADRPGHRQDVQRGGQAGVGAGVDREGDKGGPQRRAARGSPQHAADDDALLVDVATGGHVPQSILLAAGRSSFPLPLLALWPPLALSSCLSLLLSTAPLRQ